MTKAEQARRMAWRFKVLQQACEQSRNVARGRCDNPQPSACSEFVNSWALSFRHRASTVACYRLNNLTARNASPETMMPVSVGSSQA